jgi:hypothetical protein
MLVPPAGRQVPLQPADPIGHQTVLAPSTGVLEAPRSPGFTGSNE